MDSSGVLLFISGMCFGAVGTYIALMLFVERLQYSTKASIEKALHSCQDKNKDDRDEGEFWKPEGWRPDVGEF